MVYNKDMEKYCHVQKFQVKFCESDFKDELKTSVALSYMQEVACASADELGFGYAYIKPKNLAFMVTNICCEFYKPIRLGELVSVKTWPTPPSFVVFGREYQFENGQGELLANASSRWCLVDMTTGKIAPSKLIENQDYSTYNLDKTLPSVQWKIPVFSVDDSKPAYAFTVANSEYDHNYHINNTRYADYCLNCFSVAELSKMRLTRFSISYIKQCREGEILSFYRNQVEENIYLVQGMNERQEIVVQARMEFEI